MTLPLELDLNPSMPVNLSAPILLLLACHQVLTVDPQDVQEKQVNQVKRRLSVQSTCECTRMFYTHGRALGSRTLRFCRVRARCCIDFDKTPGKKWHLRVFHSAGAFFMPLSAALTLVNLTLSKFIPGCHFARAGSGVRLSVCPPALSAAHSLPIRRAVHGGTSGATDLQAGCTTSIADRQQHNNSSNAA